MHWARSTQLSLRNAKSFWRTNLQGIGTLRGEFCLSTHFGELAESDLRTRQNVNF